MNAISRGSRNALRNPLRTVSVVLILGLSLGLALVMFAARSAVENRIASVKASIGNTVTVSPAGARGFLGGGEPLTNAQMTTVQELAHVTGVDATIDAQLQTDNTTNLQSSIEAGTLGGRGFRGIQIRPGGGSTGGTAQRQEVDLSDFTPPIFASGTSNPQYAGGQIGTNLELTSGEVFASGSEANEALVGKNVAEKNSLSVGSTFTAYGQDIKVKGIYDAGNQFANNSVVFPLRTLQTLSSQADQVTAAVVRVDSAENLSGVTAAVKSTLGEAADVTSSEDQLKEAIAPLNNIRTIATTSLIGTLAAAAVIILLTMVMIVRERRKEIAVLKALGAGERTIITQFTMESFILSLFGIVVGGVLGGFLSNPIVKALVSSANSSDGPGTLGGGPGGSGGTAFRVVSGGFRALGGAVQDLQAVIDWQTLLIGLGAALLVAVLGSIIPAWLIGQVRPAEVLRSE